MRVLNAADKAQIDPKIAWLGNVFNRYEEPHRSYGSGNNRARLPLRAVIHSASLQYGLPAVSTLYETLRLRKEVG